ncbi:MAG: hypothetical protein GXP47_06750 [Acidobacteria bacterium]|nr:hypothetical protein [Acidobacteriota bacterium]
MKGSPTVDVLRAALADAGPGVDLPGSEDLEKIQRAVDGQLSRREVLALADRTADDPGLVLAWRLALELREQLAPAAAPAPVPVRVPRPSRRTVLAGLALAASVVLVVWFGLPSRSVKRGSGEPTITTPLADGAALPRNRFELVWTAPFPRASFDVDVLTGDLRRIYRAEGVRATHLVVPAKALAGIPSDGTVLWRVEALAPSGQLVLSPTFVQRLE